MNVVEVLETLRGQLGEGGLLKNEAMAARALAIQTAGGADPGDILVGVRPAATLTSIERLDALARAHLGGPLPAEVRALYGACDGIHAGVRGAISVEGDHYERGLQPIARIIEELSSPIITVTLPSGEKVERHLAVFPLVDVPDQGWLALDPWRPGWPMIVLWFDEVDLGEGIGIPDQPECVSAGCTVVAPSLAAGLSRWIASGFDVFWPNHDQAELLADAAER